MKEKEKERKAMEAENKKNQKETEKTENKEEKQKMKPEKDEGKSKTASKCEASVQKKAKKEYLDDGELLQESPECCRGRNLLFDRCAWKLSRKSMHCKFARVKKPLRNKCRNTDVAPKPLEQDKWRVEVIPYKSGVYRLWCLGCLKVGSQVSSEMFCCWLCRVMR